MTNFRIANPAAIYFTVKADSREEAKRIANSVISDYTPLIIQIDKVEGIIYPSWRDEEMKIESKWED